MRLETSVFGFSGNLVLVIILRKMFENIYPSYYFIENYEFKNRRNLRSY